MTRKRFLKLNRALAASAGYPELLQRANAVKIPPTVRLSYEELWAPLRFFAALMGVGVKTPVPVGILSDRRRGRHGR